MLDFWREAVDTLILLLLLIWLVLDRCNIYFRNSQEDGF